MQDIRVSTEIERETDKYYEDRGIQIERESKIDQKPDQ